MKSQLNILTTFAIAILAPNFLFAKTISFKDLSPGTDVSDIRLRIVKAEVKVIKIDLGPEPLKMESDTRNYFPNNRYRYMYSPDQLVKMQPSPESVGRVIGQ